MTGELPGDAFDASERIADALEAAGIPYAIGGSMAYGLWGIPRNTNDVDVNLFVGPDRFEGALEALAAAGVRFDREEALRGMADGGEFVAWLSPWRVDVYTPSIEFSWEAAKTRREGRYRDRTRWYLSPEAIAVFKLLYFRPKDVLDLERLLVTQRRRLDAPYVRRWMVEMVGEDDPRVKKWDELCATFWRDPPEGF